MSTDNISRLSLHFARIAHWLQSLSTWRGLGLSIFLGAVGGLGFAPFGWWPIWFAVLPCMVWLLDGVKRRAWQHAFLLGWGFGFGLLAVSMHWIVYPFFVDPERHAWLLPFVIVLFPGGLALFWAMGTMAAHALWSPGSARVLAFSACVSLSEWARGHVLTGLPWSLPGYIWSDVDAVVQSASLVGIYGLSLVTVLAASVPALVVSARGVPRPSLMGLTGVLVVMLLWIFGSVRLSGDAITGVDATRIRIVQPNVPQHEKWKPELLKRNWERLIELSLHGSLAPETVIIWPEAAPPFPLLSTDGALEVLGAVLPDSTTLLTGTQRFERSPELRYFNSMVAVDGAGKLQAVYDKSHLVPFGEYLPMFDLLTAVGVTQLTGAHGGFSEGSGLRTLSVPRVPAFGPLICYEIIFPGAVVSSGARPHWLVNLTDDSWFGPWAGPYQHLGIARVRAVEEGLPIVRAANTGVSAVIDPYGRAVASLGLNRSGVVDAALPKSLNPTLYSFAGDMIFVVFSLVFVGVAAFFSRSTP